MCIWGGLQLRFLPQRAWNHLIISAQNDRDDLWSAHNVAASHYSPNRPTAQGQSKVKCNPAPKLDGGKCVSVCVRVCKSEWLSYSSLQQHIIHFTPGTLTLQRCGVVDKVKLAINSSSELLISKRNSFILRGESKSHHCFMTGGKQLLFFNYYYFLTVWK